VVTRSCNLDWESPLFSEPGPRPLVVTTEEAPAAALERADEVAELCLTLAPALVAGPAKRVAVAPTETDPNQLELLSMCEQDGSLFLRYAVHRDHDSA
jgi:riboflavin biosynthesis pyrimidine reductase